MQHVPAAPHPAALHLTALHPSTPQMPPLPADGLPWPGEGLEVPPLPMGGLQGVRSTNLGPYRTIHYLKI
jgi:hypothetical protein